MILKFMRWIKSPCFRRVSIDKNDHYYIVQSGNASAYVQTSNLDGLSAARVGRKPKRNNSILAYLGNESFYVGKSKRGELLVAKR